MLSSVCRTCSKDFYVKPSWLRKGWGIYCSQQCKRQGQKTGRIVECNICVKEVYKSGKELINSKSQKFFCGKKCQTIWRNSEFVGARHGNYITGEHSYRSILGRHKIKKICTLCQTTDSRVLAVHHVDENHKNNDLKNLAWLCHNCHFLVHHDKVEKTRFLGIILENSKNGGRSSIG